MHVLIWLIRIVIYGGIGYGIVVLWQQLFPPETVWISWILCFAAGWYLSEFEDKMGWK